MLIMEDARWESLNLLQIANQAFLETLSHLNIHQKFYLLYVFACNNEKNKAIK